MPRRRTSNKPIRRRIRLDHRGHALDEMCKTFRAVKNGDLPRADGVRDVAMLDRIRDGMPEHTASGTFTGTVHYNIVPVVSGTWFSPEACKTLLDTGRLPEGATITLLEPKPDAPKLLMVPEPDQPPQDPDKSYIEKVVTLRRKPEPGGAA